MNSENIANGSPDEKDQIDMMASRAENALRFVLSLKDTDSVLIITDESKKAIGKAFEYGAKKLGAKASSYLLPENKRPLDEIPTDLHPLFEGHQVFVNAFSGFAKETPFRIKLIKRQQSFGARIGHAPGITEDMMLKGPMTANYEEIAENAKRLMAAFSKAISAHITTSEGTDITLNIAERKFETDAWIMPGNMGNLPAGEIWCAPVEDDAEGMILVNGSIGDLGGVKRPLKIIVKDGKIASLESEDETLVSKVKELTSLDDMASVIGELGIGLNPKARLTGNLLEDEKAGGTAHIAFGYNENMPGGCNNSKTHRDFLFYDPTFEVEYEDGSKRIVIQDGKVVV
ncbi:MAG: aminopeptidase [Methanomassiliicoccales archaeon]|nr:MAG: aminopeptidase [Methanomassiliicoccales archaeon]